LSKSQLRTTLALKQNILDILLTQLSPYRKRDPAKNDDDEEEFVENAFDALCTCVQTPEGKSMFLDLEGVELCLLFLNGDGKVARSRGLKVLDFAVGGIGGDTIAEKLVEGGGLKILFGMFMKKVFFPHPVLMTARPRNLRTYNWYIRLVIPPSHRRQRSTSAPFGKIHRKRLSKNHDVTRHSR
jgi:hypothetical protein